MSGFGGGRPMAQQTFDVGGMREFRRLAEAFMLFVISFAQLPPCFIQRP